jgi:membrane-bound serine protease (ClpP class)
LELGVPIIFFAVGVMLVLLEIFIPSFGLLTVGAIVCFVASIWKAYDPEHPGAAVVMGILAPLVTISILYFGLKYIPRTSWGRGLVLRHPSDEGAKQPPSASEASALTAEGGTEEDEMRPLVGKEGVAQSDLRPAGVAVIEGRRVDVVTEGAMIDAGARVKVVAVEGNRIVVRRVRV